MSTLRKRLDGVEERIVLQQHRELQRQSEGRPDPEMKFFVAHGYWPETATELPRRIEFTVRRIKTIVTTQWADENKQEDRKETLMTLDDKRLLIRDRTERAIRLVRQSWDEITSLESIVPEDLPFDVHRWVNMAATESDDSRLPEESIDELLGLSAGDGSKAANTPAG